MSDVKILNRHGKVLAMRSERGGINDRKHKVERTFMPSSEKHGGTAELSSSASERRIGNFSTADIGMSPR